MTLLLALLRADARRPASWLALVSALVVVGVEAGRTGPHVVASAWLCGGALAIASIGAPFPAPVSPLLRADAWAAARVGWPAAGALLGALARTLVAAGGAATGTTALAFLLGAAGTLVVRRAAARGGETDADGASLALALCGISALACMAVPPTVTPAVAVAATAATWGASCLAVRGLATFREGRRDGRSSRGPQTARGARTHALPTPLRRALVGAAMVAALAGMAWWSFLAPRQTAVDAVVPLVCFVALAAPAATVPPERLHPPLGRLMAGSDPRATVWFHAAVIAWPHLVASALLLGDRTRASGAFAIALAVASAAAVLWTLSSRRVPLGDGETRLAVALTVAVAVGLAAGR